MKVLSYVNLACGVINTGLTCLSLHVEELRWMLGYNLVMAAFCFFMAYVCASTDEL